jgi:hypothetical protein
MKDFAALDEQRFLSSLLRQCVLEDVLRGGGSWLLVDKFGRAQGSLRRQSFS